MATTWEMGFGNKSGIAINVSKGLEGISVLQIQAVQGAYQLEKLRERPRERTSR
jgi:hypothetical protein